MSEKAEKISNIRCRQCKGAGLIKGKAYLCNHCCTSIFQSCMYCENVNKSNFTECSNCIGSGREIYNKIANNTICHDLK